MTEPVDVPEDVFADHAEVDEETEAMEATTLRPVPTRGHTAIETLPRLPNLRLVR